ncbi:16S rRNA (guanine(966)-N(2))-methyltransferase RsmD [Paludicola sp. MB14-C6]|uniref:16S rRNA (guanine(966)-N(2))-methyltransferase RsmD n=1 Tax=Paludihabitans sp. MB14-C6 TaxID=3070656 RepID=UPI0027DD83AB|nr:16S rRNA (guanine(966)-N(2))-methyltransferase RsmD [Paludicola sp. MB14-C6]WMJ23607.1 16S rRNA (guanine(966)-N(2))-methyltransferase RsmD [Paludicola sp. MB14-C6]
MKVITGQARGRILITVDGLDVRPTTQKVKEAVFSIIQFDVPYAKVLDLFCGSGQMGIEALSRDADFCVFVDSSKKSQEVTKQNLVNTNLLKKARVVAMDYKSFLTTTKDTFDIAFLDPPYNKGILPEALPLLVQKMNDSGIILCEHEDNEEIPTQVGNFKLFRQYHYGRICISTYKNCDAENI